MRNISAGAIQRLTAKNGGEPLNIIEVQWVRNGPKSTYGDKSVPGVDGRLISLDNIEDVINVSNNGTSQSVSIILDDIDGALKEIFNNTDIHRRSVWIYQWFSGLDISDKFLLFKGLISSPITWKEGDRTLSFTVLSEQQDVEVGFSAEDGQFPNLPQALVGKPWPLCFGTCVKMPCLLVDDIAHSSSQGDSGAASTKDPVGISDPSIEKQILDNSKNTDGLAASAQFYFILALEADYTARKNGELGELDDLDIHGKGQFSGLAKQYLKTANGYLLQLEQITKKSTTLKNVLNKQKTLEKKSISVTNGAKFPQGSSVNVNIGGAVHTGYFEGNTFHITERFHPDLERYDGMVIDDLDTRQGFPTFDRSSMFFADAGQVLNLAGLNNGDTDTHDPLAATRYIIAASIQVTVQSVVAYKTDPASGLKYLTSVPSNYYDVLQVNYGSLPVTVLYLDRPLSARTTTEGKSEGWEDDIWVTVQSPIGPNTVDIIQWLIETYTNKGIDAASFASVRASVNNYPSHFAVLDRPNVLDLISKIAYQARCIVWLKNDIFYIKYLPTQDTPVDTITLDDIIEQTLEVTTTDTEQIYTKLTAEWKSNYMMDKPNKIICRYNIIQYGVQENTVDWFIYNMQQLVQKSATFWLIREANTFKKVKFTTPLHKLRIETLDTITLDFGNNILAYTAVPAIVEEANFRSDSQEIEFTCWVPVRAGEMTIYPFCYPAGLDIQYIFPTEEDINAGKAGGGSSSALNSDVKLPTTEPKTAKAFTGDSGNGGQLNITKRPLSYGVDPSYVSDEGNSAPEILQRLDSTNIVGIGGKPTGTTKYQFDRQTFTKQTAAGAVNRVLMGKIESGSGQKYTVKMFFEGVGGEGTSIKDVKAPGVSTEETLPVDMVVSVLQTVWDDKTKGQQSEYIIVPPVWN